MPGLTARCPPKSSGNRRVDSAARSATRSTGSIVSSGCTTAGAHGDHPRPRYVRWRSISWNPLPWHRRIRASLHPADLSEVTALGAFPGAGWPAHSAAEPPTAGTRSELPRTGRLESGSALLAEQDGSRHRLVVLRGHRTDREPGNPFPGRGPVSAIHTQMRRTASDEPHARRRPLRDPRGAIGGG